MASRRMLPDTVVIGNYLGEVDDVAAFQYTTIKNVYCTAAEGVSVSNTGRRPNDGATLYIFHRNSVATGEDGRERTYLPYRLWSALEDKSSFWTIYGGGRDTFRKIGNENIFRISSFSELKTGTPRMWHFEVRGI